jgi:hypothetical protein
VAKQRGDIAEAYNPFRMPFKGAEVYLVEYAGGAIAAAGTKNGFDVGAVECLLQVLQAQGIVSGKDPIPRPYGGAYFCLQPPTLQDVYGGSYVVAVNQSGSGNDGDFVAGLEGRNHRK